MFKYLLIGSFALACRILSQLLQIWASGQEFVCCSTNSTPLYRAPTVQYSLFAATDCHTGSCIHKHSDHPLLSEDRRPMKLVWLVHLCPYRRKTCHCSHRQTFACISKVVPIEKDGSEIQIFEQNFQNYELVLAA